jgi:hypothetical protein
MAGENGTEDNDQFAGFTTHEADGKESGTSEGAQNTGVDGDDGASTNSDEGNTDEGGDEAASEELDGAGSGDDTDTDEDGDNAADEEGDGDHIEGEELGTDDDVSESGDGEGGDGDGKPKKKTVRERIGEVTKARRVAERRAETAENALAAVNARLEALEKGSTNDDGDGSEENSDQGSDLKAPSPDDFTYGEMDPKYTEALTDYRMDLREERNSAKQETTRQAEAEQQEAVELQTAMDDTIAVGVEAYDDFEDVVVKAVDDGKFPLSPALAYMGVHSPVGHHVLHQLANDLPLAKKIVAMPAHEQIAEFGRLSAQYTEDSGKKPKPNKTPRATPPPSGRKGQKGPKKFNASTSSFDDFEKTMNEDLARQPKEF